MAVEWESNRGRFAVESKSSRDRIAVEGHYINVTLNVLEWPKSNDFNVHYGEKKNTTTNYKIMYG